MSAHDGSALARRGPRRGRRACRFSRTARAETWPKSAPNPGMWHAHHPWGVLRGRENCMGQMGGLPIGGARGARGPALGQVLRDSRFRVASPGNAFRLAEREQRQRQTAAFFGAGPPGGKAGDSKRRAKPIPRLASFDWLVAVDNSLRWGTGRGLERFAEVDQYLLRGEAPPTLVIAMDQEQTQWTALHFLQYGPPELCCLGIFDNFHRRHNDLWAAMKGSGMIGYYLCKIPELNLSYGPFQNSAWMSDYMDGASDLAQALTPDDHLLLRLWPGICKDMQFHVPELQGRSARAEFLRELPSFPIFNKKGPKAATSRWMSWQGAFRFHDRYHHTKLLVSVYVSMQKGWIASADEVWAADEVFAAADAKGPGQQEGVAEPPPRPVAASSSSSTCAAPPCSAEPPAKQARRDTRPLEALRSTQKGKFKNTFVAVTKAMANPDLLFGARMIATLTAGEELAHGLTAKTMRGPEKTVEFFIGWALYSWLEPLGDMIASLADPLALGAMGISVEFLGVEYRDLTPQSPLVVCEDIHCARAVRFASELLRTRCSSMSWHTSSYPGLLGPLLSRDRSIVDAHMELFKRHASAYEAAKEIRRPEIARMVQRSCMRGKFMQSCIFFAKRNEWRVSPQLIELVEAAFLGLRQTKMNEDANQQVRDLETRASAHKLHNAIAVWNVPVASKLLSKCQWKEATVDPSVPTLRLSSEIFKKTCEAEDASPPATRLPASPHNRGCGPGGGGGGGQAMWGRLAFAQQAQGLGIPPAASPPRTRLFFPFTPFLLLPARPTCHPGFCGAGHQG